MSALTKITTRAKQLRRIHKTMTWKAAVKKASEEYNRGGLGRKSAKRRAPVKRKVKRARRVGVAKPAAVRGSSNMTIGSAKQFIKQQLKDKIDANVLRKFHARLKRDKKKFQKVITATKAELRKLA